MAKPIEMTTKQWARFEKKLKEDYPPSVLLIRSKMEKVLGFVVRDHRSNKLVKNAYGDTVPEYTRTICLDFYSEKKRTYLILKYSDYFDGQD